MLAKSKPNTSLQTYARDSLEILRQSVHLYQQGHIEFYRVAALQLRLLLCDTTRRHNQTVDISLLPRLVPGLKLARIGMKGINTPDLPLLALQEWLSQPLPLETNLPITIRQLIRQVCDQDGGAHVDIKPNSGLEKLNQPAEWIMCIARVVVFGFYCCEMPK
jgi:hypothetical protein